MKMMLKTIVMGLAMSLLLGLSLAQAKTTVIKDEVTNIKITVRGGALTCAIDHEWTGYLNASKALIELKNPDLKNTLFKHKFFRNNRFGGEKETLCLSVADIIYKADTEGKSVVQKRVVLSFTQYKTEGLSEFDASYLSERVVLTFPNKVVVTSSRTRKLEK